MARNIEIKARAQHFEQLRERGFNGLDDLMGKGSCAGEPNIEAVIAKLLRLEKDERPFCRQFIFSCLDAGVLDGQARHRARADLPTVAGLP